MRRANQRLLAEGLLETMAMTMAMMTTMAVLEGRQHAVLQEETKGNLHPLHGAAINSEMAEMTGIHAMMTTTRKRK